MTDAPRIQLNWLTTWCPEHRAPFRARWPQGAGTAMLKLFEAWVQDERVSAMSPKDAAGLAKAEALPALAIECSPLCCFIAPEQLDAIYAETLPTAAGA